MRHAGRVNQAAIERGFSLATPGVTLLEVNSAIENYILENGCKPAFKNYQPSGSTLKYLYATCLSVNNAAV